MMPTDPPGSPEPQADRPIEAAVDDRALEAAVSDERPIEAVVFDVAALVGPAALGPDAVPVPRPGASRLLAALHRRGIAVHLAARQVGDDPLALLAAAGVPVDALAGVARRAVGPGGGPAAPDRTLVVTVPPNAADAGTAPDRTVGAAPPGAPGADAGSTPGPRAASADSGAWAPHRAVLARFAERIGAYRGAALLTAPLDAAAVGAAEEHHLRLTKPPGSLGRLEQVGVQLAGIAAAMPPPLPRPAAVAVFAGDHGVHRQGVSPWPQEVTAQMVANFLAGGAAINVLARQAGAEVVVVDVGVASDLPPSPGLLVRKVRQATDDLTVGAAMTVEEARRALDVGAEVATHLVDRGARCLVTGDMGIANTTPSAALIAALANRPAPAVTGRGTGIDDDLLRRKIALVAAAASRARHVHGDDALSILAEIGGLEHAALAGFIVGAAALQVPVVVDGVIAASGLLVASRLVPGVERCVIAGHRSIEPGASAVLGELGLDPMVDLGLRLGEGTGAVLALPLVEAAARVLDEMATFDQAGVTKK